MLPSSHSCVGRRPCQYQPVAPPSQLETIKPPFLPFAPSYQTFPVHETKSEISKLNWFPLYPREIAIAGQKTRLRGTPNLLTCLQISDPTKPEPPATKTVDVEGPISSASSCSEAPGGGVESTPSEVWDFGEESEALSSLSVSDAEDMRTLRIGSA